jgi:hypothetical protein
MLGIFMFTLHSSSPSACFWNWCTTERQRSACVKSCVCVCVCVCVYVCVYVYVCVCV